MGSPCWVFGERWAEATEVEITDVAASNASMSIGGFNGLDDESGQVEGRVATRALQMEPAGGESDGFFSVWAAP